MLLSLNTSHAVGSVTPFTTASAVAECLKNIGRAAKVETIQGAINLFHLDLPDHGYYFASDGHKVFHLTRYSAVDKRDSALPKLIAQQVLIHRVMSGAPIAGLAKKVFWEYLFQKTGCIVSDLAQPESDQDAWEYMIVHALSIGKKVRVIPHSNTGTFVDYSDSTAFFADHKTMWGSKNWFAQKMLVIFD